MSITIVIVNQNQNQSTNAIHAAMRAMRAMIINISMIMIDDAECENRETLKTIGSSLYSYNTYNNIYTEN